MQTVTAVVKSVWKWKAVFISVKPKGIIALFMGSLSNLMTKCVGCCSEKLRQKVHFKMWQVLRFCWFCATILLQNGTFIIKWDGTAIYNSPSHTWLIVLIQFIALKNNWMNPCVKTKEKRNEPVNNELKIMWKKDSLHQIMRVSK